MLLLFNAVIITGLISFGITTTVIIIIIMFVYSIDDITRNLYKQHPPRKAALYIQKVKPAKLLPHMAHGG